MLVTFIRDFRGRASNEQYFEIGDVADLDSEMVRALLAENAVEVVTVIEAAPEPEVPEPAEAPVHKKRGKK